MKLSGGGIYAEEPSRRLEAELEKPIEYGAAFARAVGNRSLAKAIRQVLGALVAIEPAFRYGHDYVKQRSSYQEQWFVQHTNRWEPTEAEKAILQPLLEQYNQAVRDASSLLSQAKDRLRQLRAQARVRLARARVRAAEIDEWKQRQTELQAAAHALAAIHRVPDAPEDEGGNGR